MPKGVQLVAEELRWLKRQGIQHTYLSDETVKLVRQWVREAKEQQASAPPEEPAGGAVAFEAKAETAGIAEPPEDRTAKKQAVRASGFAIEPLPEPPVIELPEGSKAERMEWLRDRVLHCPVCNAHARIKEGKKVVFGVGSLDANIFFCGEAPGADEEDQGEPFVGKAGQLLTKIIEAMELKREDVYIGNILKWRPEKEDMRVGNRPPTPEEMAFCLPYLRAQIEVVKPKVIVALGMTAVTGLLGPGHKMRDLRGKWQEFQGTPLMVTYHPSYLLRYASPEKKREVWEDMMAVMEKVGLRVTDRQRGYFLPK